MVASTSRPAMGSAGGGPLWLIGMMGSGKSTVAPLAAATLGREWVDTDDLVESEADRSIPELFEAGEELFRRYEREVIGTLAEQPLVVAVGGGAVTTAAAAIIAEHGVAVWLRADAETLRRRLLGDDSRPLLAGSGPAELERLVDARREQYARVADAVIDTDEAAPFEVAQMVCAAWRAEVSG